MFTIKCLFLAITVKLILCEPTGTLTKLCKKDDYNCMTAAANGVLTRFYKGFPELGVDTSDPIFVSEINGDLAGLKYKFTNTTVTGFKNCEVDNVKLNTETMKLSFGLHCKNLAITGHYIINGRLIVLPIEGEGEFNIVCSKYVFTINADLKETKDSAGNQHLSIKQYKYNIVDQDKVTYRLENLFNGQKDLSDAVHKFANENWKEVADFVQEPVISALMKKLMKNLSHYLKAIPLSEMFAS